MPRVVADRMLARVILRMASLLVPGAERGEWLEEWEGEVEALRALRRSGTTPGGLPGTVAFALGAVPDAVWMRTEGWTMDGVWQDVRFGMRMLLRSPGFTLVAAVTLALGIGANASIFSLINGLLLRPPGGIEAPERLVQIARSYESAPRWDNFSWPALELISTEDRVFSGVAGFSMGAFTIGRGAETEQVLGEYASGRYFEILGVRPGLGRLLRPDDDVEPGGHPVVVLSHDLWVRRFGADPEVVGSTLSVGSVPYQVVGVAPEGFRGVQSLGQAPALWVPAMQRTSAGSPDLFGEWGSSWIYPIGRLADGAGFEQARAAMRVMSSRLREAAPENGDMEVLLAPGIGLDPEGREEGRQLSLILFVIVGVVLLITCTNVANLFLARATGRRTEVGVRVALGAGRGRIARQLLTESLLLAVLATILAVPVVAMADRFLPLVFPYRLNVPVGADASVWAFLVLVGMTAGLLFGAAPAWSAVRRDMARSLREGGATGGRSGHRLRDGLVVAQLGLSLGLVSAAALLGRSVLNARSADAGFEARGVIGAPLNLYTTGRYSEEEGRELLGRVTARAAELPGVRAASVANQMPVAGMHARSTVLPPGREDLAFEAEYIVVGPRYFETLGIPVLEGRVLSPDGAEEVERVVVVNRALANRFWPGGKAVGKELLRGQADAWRVVGVVQDVQMRSLRARAAPAVYFPLSQEYSPFMTLHLGLEPGITLGEDRVRAAVAEVDPELPVPQVVDLQQAVLASMAESRTIGYLVAAFAGLALVLAVVGLYGLVSYAAAQRVRELGIRLALGAHPGSLARLVLGRGLLIVVAGVVVGLGVSYALGSALERLLFGVRPGNLAVLGSAATFLLATAVLAAWLPARRAGRVDAAVTLREGR
ncbi:MAG TPA: ABC transporter permease [Longimicrobiales bacterium]|nr:ABC transporter permease [Longimicrobiales bacterium]